MWARTRPLVRLGARRLGLRRAVACVSRCGSTTRLRIGRAAAAGAQRWSSSDARLTRFDGIRATERTELLTLHAQLSRIGAASEDVELIAEGIRHLEEMFMICVVGEFNSGKSSLINALLEDKVLKEGVTPTTADVCVVGHVDAGRDAAAGRRIHSSTGDRVSHHAELLRGLVIVDTPGTNAVVEGHQELTEAIVPRADLILFVTNADRPFSESERHFLDLIWKWRKNVVVVVNKFDIAATDEDRQSILKFVGHNAKKLLGHTPPIFAISARSAQPDAPAAPKHLAAGFAQLREFIGNTLSDEEKTRLKLLSPAQVAVQLCQRYQDDLAASQRTFNKDRRTLDAVEVSMQLYEDDMRRQFDLQEAKLDNVLAQLVARADEFLDKRVQLTEFFSLLNTSKFRDDFTSQVVGSVARDIDAHIADMAAWLVQSVDSQAHSALHMASAHDSKSNGGAIQYMGVRDDRTRLLDDMRRASTAAMSDRGYEQQVTTILDSIKSSLTLTSAIEAGSLGLTTALFAMSVIDWTGVAVGGAFALSGLYLLPYRRRKLKAQLREQVDDTRQRLRKTVRKELEAGLQRGAERVESAVMPFKVFVDTNLAQTAADADALRRVEEKLAILVNDLQKPGL